MVGLTGQGGGAVEGDVNGVLSSGGTNEGNGDSLT